MSITVANRFLLRKKLGSGSFGEVFEAEDLVTKKIVAVKIEPFNVESPQIPHEAEIYKLLSPSSLFDLVDTSKLTKSGKGRPNSENSNLDNSNISHDPNLRVNSNVSGSPEFYGEGSDRAYRFIAMEYLGFSLEHLFNICHQRFTLKTVLMIVEQSLSIVEYLHKKNLLYRDIKPDNFVIGRGNNLNKIYLIDYGLSTSYIDPETNQHIEYKENMPIVGTARYASINALLGRQQSRRDDLLALGYMFIYFLKGTLPWAGITHNNGNNYDNYNNYNYMNNNNFNTNKNCHNPNNSHFKAICEMKQKTSLQSLCANLPTPFLRYMEAVGSLQFGEEPKYSEYRAMFRQLFVKFGSSYDYVYDWSNNETFLNELSQFNNEVCPPKIHKPPVSPRLFPPTPREKRLMKERKLQKCQTSQSQVETQKNNEQNVTNNSALNASSAPTMPPSVTFNLPSRSSPRFSTTRKCQKSPRLPPILQPPNHTRIGSQKQHLDPISTSTNINGLKPLNKLNPVDNSQTGSNNNSNTDNESENETENESVSPDEILNSQTNDKRNDNPDDAAVKLNKMTPENDSNPVSNGRNIHKKGSKSGQGNKYSMLTGQHNKIITLSRPQSTRASQRRRDNSVPPQENPRMKASPLAPRGSHLYPAMNSPMPPVHLPSPNQARKLPVNIKQSVESLREA
ncbi:casein kinase I-like 12 [Tritrichomonas foetus]|uniref:non-specific serine/threonine protein kinase n=1 Tax=Tritrichomonas foetus TaxID=1144522 RepID=A0A1J4JSS2_9EUKA|nr:casein kinase I-like 12 [Tritrichomonas foetus]|eukprot:OHT02161.1 casein kinase I-like 12 [Tritrichomonas foetus]